MLTRWPARRSAIGAGENGVRLELWRSFALLGSARPALPRAESTPITFGVSIIGYPWSMSKWQSSKPAPSTASPGSCGQNDFERAPK